jgi:hypothetical protein
MDMEEAKRLSKPTTSTFPDKDGNEISITLGFSSLTVIEKEDPEKAEVFKIDTEEIFALNRASLLKHWYGREQHSSRNLVDWSKYYTNPTTYTSYAPGLRWGLEHLDDPIKLAYYIKWWILNNSSLYPHTFTNRLDQVFSTEELEDFLQWTLLSVVKERGVWIFDLPIPVRKK